MARSVIKKLETPPMPEVGQMTTEQLKNEFARSLEVTASHLVHLASVWRELEHRGEDLSGLRGGLWAYMPLIASGKLKAEIVVKYAGHSMLLRKLSELQPEDQERLLVDNTVRIVDYDDGEWVERSVQLPHLKSIELSQVFTDHIRTPDEQRRAALGRASRQTPGRQANDRMQSIVEIARNHSIPAPDDKNRASIASNIVVSGIEREAFDRHVATHGVSASRLIRAALIKAGLLK